VSSLLELYQEKKGSPMAKFKKNFWRDRSVVTEQGKVVNIPEPEWFARQKDPTDRVTQSQGFKPEYNPRPEGALIPRACVGGRVVLVKEAFDIYKRCNTESFRLPFGPFKVSLINGTKFKTTQGIISKPEEK